MREDIKYQVEELMKSLQNGKTILVEAFREL